MRVFFTLFLNGFVWQFICCQNLVPNPSFEDTLACPQSMSQLNYSKFWYSPTQGTPDYYNACDPTIYGMNVPYTGFGYQSARSGLGFAAAYAYNKGLPNYREYLQAKLIDTLFSGRKYLVSFYVNLSNIAQYSVSSFGLYFSSVPISSTNSLVLSYTPQVANNSAIQLSDSVNWMLIQDTIISDGTETYLTIGNFKNDNQSDTSYIGWWSSNNIAYYYVDDVSVIDVEALSIKENTISQSISVYPNPTTGMLNISDLNCSDKEVSIEITDVTGKIVVRTKSRCIKGVAQLTLDLNNGVYFIKATGENLVERKGKVIIAK